MWWLPSGARGGVLGLALLGLLSVGFATPTTGIDSSVIGEGPCNPDQVYTGQEVAFAFRVELTVAIGPDEGFRFDTYSGTYAYLDLQRITPDVHYIYRVVGLIGDLCA